MQSLGFMPLLACWPAGGRPARAKPQNIHHSITHHPPFVLAERAPLTRGRWDDTQPALYSRRIIVVHSLCFVLLPSMHDCSGCAS